jgi:hypothetical protein
VICKMQDDIAEIFDDCRRVAYEIIIKHGKKRGIEGCSAWLDADS